MCYSVTLRSHVFSVWYEYFSFIICQGCCVWWLQQSLYNSTSVWHCRLLPVLWLPWVRFPNPGHVLWMAVLQSLDKGLKLFVFYWHELLTFFTHKSRCRTVILKKHPRYESEFSTSLCLTHCFTMLLLQTLGRKSWNWCNDMSCQTTDQQPINYNQLLIALVSHCVFLYVDLTAVSYIYNIYWFNKYSSQNSNTCR